MAWTAPAERRAGFCRSRRRKDDDVTDEDGGLKAIETLYKGYRFRSRLEARWAVFFDAAGIRYEYEPEGFDLGEAGWYLPDFRIPIWDAWVEIKPFRDLTADELAKILALRNAGQDVLLIRGNPCPREYRVTVYYRGTEQTDTGFFAGAEAEDGRAIICARHTSDPIEYWIVTLDRRPSRWQVPGALLRAVDLPAKLSLDDAFAEARSARFGKDGRG